jgi:oligopeptide/dipeptide ABC transporter ATP-binding protein
MITHDLSTAARYADRIAVMYLGRIVEQGTATEVIRTPLHPYTRALLAAVPRADPRDHGDRTLLVGDIPDPTALPTGCRFHPRCPLAEARCADHDPALAPAAAPHRAACLVTSPEPAGTPTAGSDGGRA